MELGALLDFWVLHAAVQLPAVWSEFVPCRMGADRCRLRPLEWEQCGRGLNTRHRESAHPAVVVALLGQSGYFTCPRTTIHACSIVGAWLVNSTSMWFGGTFRRTSTR